MRPGALVVAVVLAASSCGGSLVKGLFVRGALAYRVAEPPAGEWRRAAFADNDLAWVHSATGHVLAVNATCEGHEDPPLEVLTTHLLIGFSEREQRTKKTFTLDGREALRTTWRAKLDGVPTHLDLVVLKKNGCVHDLTYVSPAGGEGAQQAAFDALVAAFRQERAP